MVPTSGSGVARLPLRKVTGASAAGAAMELLRQIEVVLDNLSAAYGRQGRSQRLARKLYSSFEGGSIQNVFQTGLHEFLTHFITDNQRIGAAISEQYLA